MKRISQSILSILLLMFAFAAPMALADDSDELDVNSMGVRH